MCCDHIILSRIEKKCSPITENILRSGYITQRMKRSKRGNHFSAIKRLLKTKSMPEIKDMYDRRPLIKSIKSITSITVINRRVTSIDFYRLIDTIDNDQVIDIDSY